MAQVIGKVAVEVEVRPYFADGARYPALIGVRAKGDEYEMAYVSKQELIDALKECDELLDENNRLRKLCGDMWAIIDDYDDTPYLKARQGKNLTITWLDADWEPINECKRRMRELGVEVVE